MTTKFLSFLLLLSLTATSAFAADKAPSWIWSQSEAQSNSFAHFRKEFSFEGELKKAMVATSCDNVVTLFVNGEKVLQSRQWEKPVREEVTKLLKPGKNIIAARCQNQGGPAGFILQLNLEFADGKQQTLVTDNSWLSHPDPKGNYRTAKYQPKGWKPPKVLGKLGAAPWGTQVILDPNQIPKAMSTAAERITVPEGFEVELLYSVPKATQGSWVSITHDPKGRLIVSDQYGSLYRVVPGNADQETQVEKLPVDIGAAQGLLYAFDALYVVVNGNAAEGSGLYRVTDTDGDDQFDKVELLKKLRGGGEHGPHAVRLGPDGMLYVIAGNHTTIPEGIAEDSPHRNWDEDLLLPRNPDGRGHATGRMAPGGWIARTDKDGKEWELFCAGFRNPYDIDFNQHGELFTYDADMEWDTGTPWYRATRVNHCVSAAEFGWRFGTGKWPDYFPDSVGAVVDIGLGSPTGIEFGTNAKFPAKYQHALFINDWTYGKIYAVHLKPDGATYDGSFEVFVQGKPLPVTDVTINPHDGAMYFTIGGRRTQSGLYRVTYQGNEPTSPAPPPAAGEKARELRRALEAFHGTENPEAIAFAWPHLNSSDRAIRYAARIAVEHQPLEQWQQKAFQERRTNAAIQAMLAVTRTAEDSLQASVLERLNELPLERITEEQLLDTLRVYSLAFIRLGGKNPETVRAVAARLSSLFPSNSKNLNRELCRVLVYLEAPQVIERSMKLLSEAQTQEDQFFYAFLLRNVESGWTPEQRKAYFSWLNLAERKYKGGASFVKFVQQVRRDALEKLSKEQYDALAEVIKGEEEVEVVKLETTRQFIHNWQADDLLPILEQSERGRNFEKGKLAFKVAQCYKCHRFRGEGGDTGPDITGVGNRFDNRYLLESLIEPSKAVSDQYQLTIVETVQGEVITGRLIEETDELLKMRTDPFALKLTEIKKDDIEYRETSKLSQMPLGLINVLTKEEILDLIAFMRSGGDPNDPAFKK